MLKDVFEDKLREAIEGMSRGEAEYFIEHDAIPDAGSIPGLMYTDDIMDVFANNYAEIQSVTGKSDTCDPMEMVYSAWFVLLSEVGDAVLEEIDHEEVVDGFIFDFLLQDQAVYTCIYDFVDMEDDERLRVDTEIASDEDEFRFELRAYIRYMCKDGDILKMEEVADNFASKMHEYSGEALDIIIRRKVNENDI
jgi:hypothetical protein